MLKTVEGLYTDGKVQLSEEPQEVDEQTQVLVTFLSPGTADPQKLRQLIEQLETVIGIQQGFAEVNAGKTRSIDAFAQEMRHKYDISD